MTMSLSDSNKLRDNVFHNMITLTVIMNYILLHVFLKGTIYYQTERYCPENDLKTV
jgi:hypothetical protein